MSAQALHLFGGSSGEECMSARRMQEVEHREEGYSKMVNHILERSVMLVLWKDIVDSHGMARIK